MSFQIGIPKRYYRRATQVLSRERSNPVNYDVFKQDDGFYMFSFPGADEYDFRNIIIILNKAGILTVGDDEVLSERKIMKLTDILKEQGSPEENDIIDGLEAMYKRWQDPQYRGGVSNDEKAYHYNDDLRDFIDDYLDKDEEETIKEQKYRKVIRKLIRRI